MNDDIPSVVNVLGQPYRIVREKIEDFGGCDSDAKIITIRKGLRSENRQKTLLHETLHAVLAESGHAFQMGEGAEEAVVRAIENGLYQAGWRYKG